MDVITMDVLQVLRDKLRADMNNYTDDLANGQCSSFEQYKELCGVIRGLAYAERHLIDLAENIEKANDE
jgi:hypothetical protein